MQAFQVVESRPSALGLTSTPTQVNNWDIEDELGSRGYVREATTPVVPKTPPGQILTKTMAISVSIDEALSRLSIPHTASHPYRCPSGTCPIESNTYQTMVDWCESVANGYLVGQYELPAWAQTALTAGTLKGLNWSGLGHLGGFGDWISDNPWFLQSVGDSITNYGEHLTAQNVQAAIKDNTAKQLTKDDALALVAALQQGGYVPAGKSQTVAEGANLAAGNPSWLMPAVIGGGVLLAMMLMKK